ncbi:MAG TPA: DUF763 domain-containing protein [Pirellulales bacterium]|jgi:hypothetical protein|nr:DUF763 domain-containing protein [Pirellulales bacterium]
MKRSGYADLPLHSGRVPPWLAHRMASLGGAISESIILDYGKGELLARLADPFWFQAFGCVLGMDWHSSGITTSVLSALKRSLRPKAAELGLYVCGGRGRSSLNTPAELIAVGEKTGLNATELVYASRLSARVDNNAVADGFQLYLHGFIVTAEGQWVVVQQGLNDATGMARRYHWRSAGLASFVKSPHAGIAGEPLGEIVNLVDAEAGPAQQAILEILRQPPEKNLQEIGKLVMDRRHAVGKHCVDLKRLGAVLATAYERSLSDFASALLVEKLGPRTLQSLALVAEVIHGAPARFRDPARSAFAHGGKDGHPFPVPTTVYDRTVEVLQTSLEKAKVGDTQRTEGLARLHRFVLKVERESKPRANFEQLLAHEHRISHLHGGRSVFGPARKQPALSQRTLFQ